MAGRYSFSTICLLSLVCFVGAYGATLDSSAPESESAHTERNFKKENWENNPIMAGKPEREIQRIRTLRQEILNNGCDTNICFVVDGSAGITDEDFEEQKNFIDLIIAITTTDSGGNFCGVVTANSLRSISVLTGNKDKFLKELQDLKHYQSKSENNVIAGLGSSIKQLRKQRQDANNVLFFAKRKPLIPRVPPYFQEFVKRGDAISAITLDSSIAEDLIQVTGDINRVMPIDGFFEISEIIVAVVADVCSTRCTTMDFSRKRLRIKNKRARKEKGPFVRCPPRLGSTRKYSKFARKDGEPVFLKVDDDSSASGPKDARDKKRN